jgi:hypothetical protein
VCVCVCKRGRHHARLSGSIKRSRQDEKYSEIQKMLADARAAQDAAAKAAAEAERAMQLANEKAMCEMKRLGLTEDREASGGFAQLQPPDTGLTTPVGEGTAPRSATPIGPALSGEHRFSRPEDLETWEKSDDHPLWTLML